VSSIEPNDGDGQLGRGEQEYGTANHAKHANPGQCVTEPDNAFDFEARLAEAVSSASILRDSRDLRLHFLSYFEDMP
jgi:hypothetical protein